MWRWKGASARCTMKNPVRAGGWDGCWDDSTGGSSGIFSPGLLPGLWIGFVLRFFKAPATKVDEPFRFSLSSGCLLGVVVSQFCHLRRRHSSGLCPGNGDGMPGLRPDPGAGADAGLYRILESCSPDIAFFMVSRRKNFKIRKNYVCIFEKMGYNSKV